MAGTKKHSGVYKHKLNCNISKKFLIQKYSKNKKTMQQIAEKLKCSEGTIRNRLIKYYIHIRTKNAFMKIKIGKKAPNYIDGRCSKKHYCKDCEEEIKYIYSKRCRPCAMVKLWKDIKFRTKTLKASMLGRLIKPNKPEKLLNKLLQQLLPKEYKYVGDGQVILDGLCPDFINVNGKKKIIEMYGDYWHNLPKAKKIDKRRLTIYECYGYKTLIVWEHELRNLNRLKQKILQFNKLGDYLK